MNELTVEHYLRQRSDNFLLLRIIAAVAVIYGHSFALAVRDGSRDIFLAHNWGMYSGEIAVNIFFVVSGFMVSGSYMARRSLGEYTKARLLRIVPGCLAVLLISAYVLGPILTSLSLREYIADPATAQYVFKNLQFSSDMAWNLPGLFVGHAYSSINGSLWTLPAEMRMYVLVAALGVLGVLRPSLLGTGAVLTLIVLGFVKPTLFSLHTDWLRLAAYFCLGILVQLNKSRLVVRHSTMLMLVFITYISGRTDSYVYLMALSIAYFCFWFAYQTPHWKSLQRWGDPSYGIYLWGWPVQKIVVTLLPTAAPWKNFVLSAPIAVGIGYLSWHFVEAPAMRLKDYPLTPAFARRLWLRFRASRTDTVSLKSLTMICIVVCLAACSQEVPQIPPAAVQSNHQQAAAAPSCEGRRTTLQITPQTFRECDAQGGAIAVTATWDVVPINVRNVSVFVESPGNARKLWFEGGASGAETTGAWVFDNTKLTLSDRDTGSVLDQVLVIAMPCEPSTPSPSLKQP